VTCDGVPQADGTERDRYGRLLGRCRAGDVDLNAAMVESGHALAFRRYTSRLVPQEDAAREARRGMWAGEFQAPWDFRAAKRAVK
jgi:endonuclease YncB( thermonuclease family)